MFPISLLRYLVHPILNGPHRNVASPFQTDVFQSYGWTGTYGWLISSIWIESKESCCMCNLWIWFKWVILPFTFSSSNIYSRLVSKPGSSPKRNLFYTGSHLSELQSCKLFSQPFFILFRWLNGAQHKLVIELCCSLKT